MCWLRLKSDEGRISASLLRGSQTEAKKGLQSCRAASPGGPGALFLASWNLSPSRQGLTASRPCRLLARTQLSRPDSWAVSCLVALSQASQPTSASAGNSPHYIEKRRVAGWSCDAPSPMERCSSDFFPAAVNSSLEPSLPPAQARA